MWNKIMNSRFEINLVVLGGLMLSSCVAIAPPENDAQHIHRLQSIVVGQTWAQVQQKLGLPVQGTPQSMLRHRVELMEKNLTCEFVFVFENGILHQWRATSQVCQNTVFPVNDVGVSFEK